MKYLAVIDAQTALKLDASIINDGSFDLDGVVFYISSYLRVALYVGNW